MGDFAADTAVTGGDSRYRAMLTPEWDVWGPLGGYVAAVALRALGAASQLPRPASFSCLFLSVAAFEPVDLEVTTLRRGRRSEALHVRMRQDGREILNASAWMVADAMTGLEHDTATAPRVPSVEALASFAERAETYSDWPRVWGTIDGRPTLWNDAPGPPVWQTWMRLFETPDLSDPVLEAARSLMWMDVMMWNAAVPPHLPWPVTHIAPSLDLFVTFHDAAPDDEWLLCDAQAPVGRHGLLGCNGRVWSPSGRLLASGTSTLLCRPNPERADG